MAYEYSRNRQDADVNPAAWALPNGAASTDSDSIDLNAEDNFDARVEFQLSIPLLSDGQLASGQSITFYLQDSADDSSFTTIQTLNEVTVTGAGAGSAAVVCRFRLPSDVRRYIRIRATKAGASNASTASATLTARF